MVVLARVRLAHPLFCGLLQPKRVPKYLRFACKEISSGDRKWDVLDMPDDEPFEGEYLIAGILKDRSTIHIDRVVNHRRIGEWIESVTYGLVDPQPSQETMRDYERWKTWCMEREKDLGKQEGSIGP